MTYKSKADLILNKVLTTLKIKDKKPGEKFNHIYKLFPELDNLIKKKHFQFQQQGL